jgi:hypothetical protein
MKNDLILRIGNNFINNYGYNESALCIFYALDGSWQDKLPYIKKWQTNDEDSRLLLDKVLNKKYGPLHNYLISDEFFKIVRFLICSILEVNFTKLLKRDEQKDFFADKYINSRSNIFWERMQRHPLIDPLIVLS